MKKILLSLTALVLVVSVNACVGTGQNPWNRSQPVSTTANSEPSQLTREALTQEILNAPQGEAASEKNILPGTVSTQSGEGWDYNSAPPSYAGTYSDNAVTTYPVDRQDMTAHAAVPNTQVPPVAPVNQAPSVKVALLVPMSGPQADLGIAMMQAAQLALFDMGYTQIELLPQDTKGTPDGARTAAQMALSQGAQLILGPIFATEARAVAPIAQQRNVNVITFSTDWTLAQGNTFVMGFLPFIQVERMVQYLAAQRQISRIGIIAPETEYGNVVVSSWNVHAGRSGLAPAHVLRVTPGNAAASEKIASFTNYEARSELIKAGTPAPTPYDAIFMPFGGSEAVSLADNLTFLEMDPQSVRRIGTGLWDDGNLAIQKNLDGAWFAASDPASRRGFERRYRETYGISAPRLSTLAYDAMSLAVVLAKTGYANYGQPAFDRGSITNPNGFAGIDGIFRFRPDGMAERGLAIIEFRNGSMQVIDPAPKSFVRTQY